MVKSTRPREAKLDKYGAEIGDPIPMAPPLGYQKEPSLSEKIRAMVRGEHVRLAALQAGAETFEEADDFDVGEDVDPSTPYEEVFDPIERDARMLLRDEDYRATVIKRSQELRPPNPEVKSDGDGKSAEVKRERVADDKSSAGNVDTVVESKSSAK